MGTQDDEKASDSEGEAWDAEDADSDGGNVDDDDEEDATPIFMAPSEVEAQFRALWREERGIVTRIWGRKFGAAATGKQEPGYGDSPVAFHCPPSPSVPPSHSTHITRTCTSLRSRSALPCFASVTL